MLLPLPPKNIKLYNTEEAIKDIPIELLIRDVPIHKLRDIPIVDLQPNLVETTQSHTPGLSIIATFLIFTAAYIIIADPFSLKIIPKLTSAFTNPFSTKTITEGNKQSTQITELKEELKRLTSERDDGANKYTQANEMIDLYNKNRITENVQQINQTEELSEEITRLASERDNLVQRCEDASEMVKTLNTNSIAENAEQMNRINELTQENSRLISDRNELSNKYIKVSELFDELKANEAAESAQQLNEINNLTERVLQVVKERDLLFEKFKEANEMVNKMQQLIEKAQDETSLINKLREEGTRLNNELIEAYAHHAETTKAFNATKAVIDEVADRLGRTGHDIEGWCPYNAGFMKYESVIRALHSQILKSGDIPTHLNLSLASDTNVALSELITLCAK